MVKPVMVIGHELYNIELENSYDLLLMLRNTEQGLMLEPITT